MILEMMMESVFFAVVDIFLSIAWVLTQPPVVGLTECHHPGLFHGHRTSVRLPLPWYRPVAQVTQNRAAAAEAGKQAVFIGILVTLLVSVSVYYSPGPSLLDGSRA